MSTSEQRAHAVVEQIDDATGRLLANQLKLVRYANNKDKSLATLATETTEIQACSLGIERAVEDMLVISRSLKEAWVLGEIDSARAAATSQRPQSVDEVSVELTKMLSQITEKLS